MLKNFRNTGYESSLKLAKKIAAENGIEPLFPEKRSFKVKRQFEYESMDEGISDEEDKYRVDYFLLIVDRAIESFNQRFELFETHRSSFGFLYNFKNLCAISNEDLLKKLYRPSHNITG